MHSLSNLLESIKRLEIGAAQDVSSSLPLEHHQLFKKPVAQASIMGPLTLMNLPSEVLELVSEHCSQHDLTKLVLTCKTAFNIGVRTLWKRDAREGNSSALSWAVRINDERLSIRIIKLSLSYGGNINAQHVLRDSVYTALHVAAARGLQFLTEYLLLKGASPNSKAVNIHLMFPAAATLLRSPRWLNNTTFNVRSIQSAEWSPAFIPYIKQDSAIVDCLLRAGADSMLASPPPPPKKKDDDGNDNDRTVPKPPTTKLTMLHAAIIMGDQREIRKRINRSPEDIEAQMMGTLTTPLHIAVAMGDEITVNALINAGAIVDAVDSTGNVPLHVSASSAARELEDFRKPQPRIAKALITAGADPNMPAVGTQTTPVLVLASRVKKDWVYAHRHIKMMLDVLIESRADLNLRDVQGKSLLYYLTRAILEQEDAKGHHKGNLAMEKLFEHLVEKGANISVPGSGNVSLAGVIIASSKAPRFQKWFMTLDPRILPHEATSVYRAWIGSGRDWYSGYNVCQLAGLVDQYVIDMTIGELWAKDNAKFQLIRKHFPIRVDPSRIVWEGQFAHVPSMGREHPKPLPKIDFDFNPNFRVNGVGYLHTIVRKFVTDRSNRYTQKHAMDDAKQFVQRGIFVGMRDYRGRTALDLFRETLPPNKGIPHRRFLDYLVEVESGGLAPRIQRTTPVYSNFRLLP